MKNRWECAGRTMTILLFTLIMCVFAPRAKAVTYSEIQAGFDEFEARYETGDKYPGTANCVAFAKELCTLIFGSAPNTDASSNETWTQTDLEYLRPGDYIRFNSSGGNQHSVVVYSVGDEEITVAESNWSYTNAAQWGRTMTFAYLRQKGYACCTSDNNEYGKETNTPVINSIAITNQSATGYRVTAVITDESPISRVLFPTWKSGDQTNTLIWLEGVRGDGNTWYADVVLADHGGATNCTYTTHIYAVDAWDNQSRKAKDVYVENVAPVISDIRVTAVSEKGFTVAATIKDASGLKSVSFPTWSTGIPKWYAGKQISSNVWSADVKFDECGSTASDRFYSHVYATDVWDNKSSLEPAKGFFLDYDGPVISEVKVSDYSGTSYRVTAMVSDASGVGRVQFATWCTGYYNDTIKWVDGVKDGDSWYVDIDIQEYGGRTNYEYITHTYAYDTMGNESRHTKTFVTVETNAPVFENLAYEQPDQEKLNLSVKITDQNELDDVTCTVWNASGRIKAPCEMMEGGVYTAQVDLTELSATGTYSAQFSATDVWGNAGQSTVISCVIDDDAPNIETISLTDRHVQSLQLSMKMTDSTGVTGVRFAVRDADDTQAQVRYIDAQFTDGMWYAQIDADIMGLSNAARMWYQGYASDAYGHTSESVESTQAIIWPVPTVDVTLPSEMIVLEDQAFFNDTSLDSVMIPMTTPMSIGKQSFAGCSALKAAVLYANVTSIAADAFEGCGNLIIYCEEESCAARYAQEHAIPVRYIEQN